MRLQPLDAVRDDTIAALRASFDALETRGIQLFERRTTGEGPAIANLASFCASLRVIGDRLLAPPLAFRSSVAQPSFRDVKPSDATRAAARRQSIRIAVAATLAYVACLASHRADLGVILWTAILAGLPTYGATLRRMFLRFVGAGLGGVLSLIVIIAVSPNFDTVNAYAPVFFIVMFISAYMGLASGRLAYAGQQAGLTFIVMYYALSPRTDAVEPLWRMWGVFVGLVIVSAVFLLVMPEYAANNMPPRLARLLRDALDLIRPESVEQVSAIHTSAIVQVNQLLAIADDARLERKYSGLDPDRAVDAAGTLLRIVDRLSALAKERLAMPPVAVPAQVQAAMIELEAGLREHLQRWLDAVEHRESTARMTDLPALREALRDQLSEPVLGELATWPARARRGLFAEIESYRRAAELVIELDGQLPAVIPG